MYKLAVKSAVADEGHAVFCAAVAVKQVGQKAAGAGGPFFTFFVGPVPPAFLAQAVGQNQVGVVGLEKGAVWSRQASVIAGFLISTPGPFF